VAIQTSVFQMKTSLRFFTANCLSDMFLQNVNVSKLKLYCAVSELLECLY